MCKAPLPSASPPMGKLKKKKRPVKNKGGPIKGRLCFFACLMH